ncbi:hypothetical protein [Xanthomonas sp. MUS 060]|nr:hypothetical protein [Xanthomonas sp. MUS 060]
MPFIVTKTTTRLAIEVPGFKDSADLELATSIVNDHFCSVTTSE